MVWLNIFRRSKKNSTDLILLALKKKKERERMNGSLNELVKTHGFGCRVCHLIISGDNEQPAEVICDLDGHYWLKTKNGNFLTIKPKEAEAGWRLWEEPKKLKTVKLTAWVSKITTSPNTYFYNPVFFSSTTPPKHPAEWIRAEHLDFETLVEE